MTPESVTNKYPAFEPQPQRVPSVFNANALELDPAAISIQSVADPICIGEICESVAGGLPV